MAHVSRVSFGVSHRHACWTALVCPATSVRLCFLRMLAVLLLQAASIPGYGATPADVARSAFPFVVVVDTVNAKGDSRSYGSGFFVGRNLVITNLHVVAGASQGTVRSVAADDTHAIVGVRGVDRENDLVVLEVKPGDSKSLVLGEDANLAIGEEVFVIGNPHGFEGTFSEGIVSGIREVEGRRILQITAPISPGSSGGPVLNSTAEVVGVAVAFIRNGQNLNFAVPVSYVKALLASLAPMVPLSSLTTDLLTPITRDDIFVSQSILLGSVRLELGMDQQRVFALVREHYSIDNSSHPYVLTNQDGSIIAIIYFDSDGRLIKVSKEWTRQDSPATRNLVRMLFELLNQVGDAGDNLFVIRTDRTVLSVPGYGTTTTYGIEIVSRKRNILIEAVEATGKIASQAVLSESLGSY